MLDVEEVLEVGTKLFLTTLLPDIFYNGIVVRINESKVWVKWQRIRDGIEKDFSNPMDYQRHEFVKLFNGRLTVRKKSLKTLKDLL